MVSPINKTPPQIDNEIKTPNVSKKNESLHKKIPDLSVSHSKKINAKKLEANEVLLKCTDGRFITLKNAQKFSTYFETLISRWSHQSDSKIINVPINYDGLSALVKIIEVKCELNKIEVSAKTAMDLVKVADFLQLKDKITHRLLEICVKPFIECKIDGKELIRSYFNGTETNKKFIQLLLHRSKEHISIFINWHIPSEIIFARSMMRYFVGVSVEKELDFIKILPKRILFDVDIIQVLINWKNDILNFIPEEIKSNKSFIDNLVTKLCDLNDLRGFASVVANYRNNQKVLDSIEKVMDPLLEKESHKYLYPYEYTNRWYRVLHSKDPLTEIETIYTEWRDRKLTPRPGPLDL